MRTGPEDQMENIRQPRQARYRRLRVQLRDSAGDLRAAVDVRLPDIEQARGMTVEQLVHIERAGEIIRSAFPDSE